MLSILCQLRSRSLSRSPIYHTLSALITVLMKFRNLLYNISVNRSLRRLSLLLLLSSTEPRSRRLHTYTRPLRSSALNTHRAHKRVARDDRARNSEELARAVYRGGKKGTRETRKRKCAVGRLRWSDGVFSTVRSKLEIRGERREHCPIVKAVWASGRFYELSTRGRCQKSGIVRLPEGRP